jgi:FixJ family two-component response regulator
MNNQGHLYIIDDDEAMRDSLASALPKFGYAISTFHSGVDFLKKVTKPVSPSVILLDMQLPDLSGLDLQNALNEIGEKIPVIFLSGQSHPQQIIDSLKRGAIDFILKPFLLEDLDRAIKKGMKQSSIQQKLSQAYDSLTPREKEVFSALAQGQLLKDIAASRQVSESVIKMHKSNLMEKLGLESLQEIAILYVELGLNKKPEL